MNKSPEYNQHTEPKQCKSEDEEICSYSPNLETGTTPQHLHTYLKINSGFHARGNPSEVKKLYLKVVKLGSHMKQ